jgi:DNA-directed RNA polymerase II subunit RPB7
VEGSCTGRHGFIVMVTHINNVSEGMITDDGTARAKFHVEYGCVVGLYKLNPVDP